MNSISSNPLSVQPQGHWQAAGVDQTQATPASNASRIDPADASEMGKAGQPGNQFLRLPSGKAADIPSTISGLDRLDAENVGSDIFSLLRLLHQCSLEQRAGARMVRQSEMQANIGTLNAAAKEIREAAFQRMLGAVVSGSLQIGSAGLQAYSATQSLKTIATLKDPPEAKVANSTESTNEAAPQEALRKDMAAQSEAGKPAPEQPVIEQSKVALTPEVVEDVPAAKPSTEREVTLKELDFQAARLRAASDITHSAGGVFNAFAQNSAASHDARKSELEAEAKAHDMSSHQASDEIQQTLEQSRTWRDMLQGIDQGSIETNRGIARNI